MDTLEELAARDRIRQLAYRYALAVDGKDLDGVAALFVEDVDNGRYGPGREGVKTFYDHVLRQFHCSMHLVANHYVDFGDPPDTATGSAYCIAKHVYEEEGVDRCYVMHIRYDDQYRRVGDGWRIAHRHLTLLWDEDHPLRT